VTPAALAVLDGALFAVLVGIIVRERDLATLAIASISSAVVALLVGAAFWRAGLPHPPQLPYSPVDAGLVALAVMLLYWVQNRARKAGNFEMGCALAILLLTATGVAAVWLHRSLGELTEARTPVDTVPREDRSDRWSAPAWKQRREPIR
jgi:hypothetical protein